MISAARTPPLQQAGLLKLWSLTDVILCSSHHALEEARINLTEETQRRRLARLSRSIHLFDVDPGELPHGVSLPDKDVPILLSSIGAKATHLITGDARHFGPYFGKTIEGILVLSPRDYLKKHLAGR